MGGEAVRAADPPADEAKNKAVLKPAAPVIPGEIVAALQEGKYDAAKTALAAAREKSKEPSERAYLGYLLAIAERLAGQRDAARETLKAALGEDPNGPWGPKIRYELSALELTAGNHAAAEEIARAEAIRLLGDDRKDKLAEIYYSFARRLLDPDDPVVQPDPPSALSLLGEARAVAKSPVLRAQLLFTMGRTSQRMNDPNQAIPFFESYLKEFPRGVDRFAARFHLGEAQRQAGLLPQARLTWSDLAREIERLKPEETNKDAQTIRGNALAEIPSTYGVPAPPDDASLNLGVAALQRFIAAYPAHPKAVRAAYEIGVSYLNRGKSDQALAAFTRFLKEEGFKAEAEQAKRDLAELTMAATFQSAQILQGQQKFDEAIAAWKSYLANFPNGPQSADAQRSILDTQLLIAADHLSRERYNEARTVWTEFVAQNPLDGRVPTILFQIGDSFRAEKKYDEAIAAWGTLTSKFPDSEPAARAQYLIALTYETEKGDPAGAIERYRKIAIDPWRNEALQRVAVMESRGLTVLTPRAYRTGEVAKLKVTTRNLEKLTFTAYKLNPEVYFRKKHSIQGVESLDIGLVAPDAEWTVDVPNYAKYKPIETSFDLNKLEQPAVYVVKVTDQKFLQATTLVLSSDIDAIVKTSRDQLLVFAQDMKTGKGRPKARVLVSDNNEVVFEGETGPDGVLLHGWSPAREGSHQLTYLVLDGGSVAGSGLLVPNSVSQGLSARAYIYSDRPAYRPGQQVAIRGVIREIQDGQYANVPKAVYRFEVSDSRGRVLVAKDITLSDFGTFQESLPLDSGAPVGTYQVRVHQPGKSEFSGSFEVQSYQLQPITLAFDLKERFVLRGETIEGDVIARYQYGAPVSNRQLEVTLPDQRVLKVATDVAGKFHLSFQTESFSEEQTLQFVANLPQDNVAVTAQAYLVVRGFSIGLSTKRTVYLDGESFPVSIKAIDARGEAIEQSISVSLVKQVNQAGRITEREAAKKTLKTDAKTGQATVTFQTDDAQGGNYIIRATGTDRFGNPIVADHAVYLSGKQDETKLRILADRQQYKVGEEASVNLHSRGRAGTVLLTWEADKILNYRIVTVRDGDNPIGWSVDGPQFPNFTLTAARMWETSFDEAKLDLQVDRDLKVTVKPVKPTVGPGEKIELEITTVDQLDRPVAAELAIAMVDRSLLRLHGDRMPAIGSFFYNQTRTGAFQTEATNTFRYAPATVPVAQAVVDEAERQAALAANLGAIDAVKGKLEAEMVMNSAAAFGTPASAPAPGIVSADSDFPVAKGGAGLGGAGDLRALRLRADRAYNSRAGDVSRDLQDQKDVFYREEMGRRAKPGMDDFAGEGLSSRSRANYWGLSDDRKSGEIRPRERFVETAYWNPSVVTDKDGKARVTFDAPPAFSEYEIMTRGVTGSDTLVGQTVSSVTVRKDFFVDLKVPASLTQGDQPRFIAQVHHVGVSGTVNLRLTVYAGGREEVYPRSIEIKGDGVEEIILDPFEVPDTDNVRLTLTAAIKEMTDQLTVEVPVRPWGVQAYASESGTSSDGATVFVGLPPGRAYENPEMLIVVSPTLQRMIVELALGRDVSILSSNLRCGIMPPPSNSLADRAADLLAATSALGYLRATQPSGSDDVQRVVARIRGLVAELIAAQNEDGGWPWVTSGGMPKSGEPQAAPTPSDRLTSASVLWALASAGDAGLLPGPQALDNGVSWLSQAMTGGTNSRDLDARAILLHALSTRKAASFELANSLNRERQNLSNTALAYLALTFANLNRPELAREIIAILIPRAKVENAAPGHKARLYWEGSLVHRGSRSAAETTALVTLALARVRAGSTELEQAVEWLQAHRFGHGWNPHRAKGPALAALALAYGKNKGSDERYKLTITVNDTNVGEVTVEGATESHVIAVPLKALKAADKNRVNLAIEGRGTFSYAVTMSGFTRDFGPDQDREQRPAWVDRRVYWPAPPMLDGQVLPSSFNTAVNPTTFENVISQVALGGKGRVGLVVWRNVPDTVPEWERDFLIVQDQLPAGTTLIEGSVITSASTFTVADGVITFYFPPGQNPGGIQYDVYGYLPGQYRALPTSVRSADEAGRYHLGQAADFKVLAPGEKDTDHYRQTPDELFARGQIHFAADRYKEAAAALEPLFAEYTLRDDVVREAARMLLLINIKEYEPRKVVQYFEVVKEKAPDLILDFDKLLVIGRAYRDINEYERAIIVWRGLIEASYLEDARVGELLRQRGKTLEAMTYLIDLWRTYPNTPSIESDFFGLSQVLSRAASEAINSPELRRELAAAGVARSELLLQTIRMIQVFLAQSPTNPMADEASLALVGAYLDLEDFEGVVRLSERYARLYSKSTYLDSFQFSEALANFHLGRYDRAVEVAEKIARAVYKNASGGEEASPNKWQALYILGQIFDARRLPGRALDYYKQVADRFTDAASAIQAFTRKDLKLPEVTVVHPPAKQAVAQAGEGEPKGLKAVGIAPPAPAPGGPAIEAGIKLDYRNIARADVTVYPVDLMQLYLTRRNLNAIAGIDLAGITPLVETSVSLGDGADYEDRVKTITLPITKEGAYLVMVRGDNLYASGIILVSPLELEVLEESASGRVRVMVRDAHSKSPLSKVQVKVIGTNNQQFFSGETDLRGVYVAEGVVGQATVVVRKETTQYAFFRGTTFIGTPPAPEQSAGQAQSAGEHSQIENGQMPALNQALDANIRMQNSLNNTKQIQRLQQRYGQTPPAERGAAAGGFR